MLNLRRRALLHLLASAAAVPAVTPLARAQSYPSRPVTLVVFVPAGGTPDIIARLVGQSLSQRLGQSVVIDNRPGGGGNVALQAVARAPADGYSLLLVATPHAVNVTLYEKSAVTVTRDIVPVASINTDSFVLLVNPSFPARTVAEFITHAKDNPGKINVASSGTGNLSHLSGELFRMMTGVEVVHVHAMFDATVSALPQIQSGALRAIGVTATARVRVLPDIPPIGDTVGGYAVTGWLGIGVPKGTPAEIVERLNRDINAVLADPAVRTRMEDLGSDARPGSVHEFGRLIAEETEKWAKVISASGARVD